MSLELINVLLINRTNIMQRTAISGNVDADKINPFILTAQDSELQYMLGTKLYSKLRQLVKDDTLTDASNSDYRILLEEYVTPTLVFFTMVDFLPFLAFEQSNGGIYQHQSENSIAASKTDTDYVVQRYSDKARFYEKRLLEYLCDHSILFPEYNQNTGSDMNPGADGRKHGWVMSRNQDGIRTSRFHT
jgi:hypothetical protein